MSAEAEHLVRAFTHPKVKGSVRILLEVIARLIPHDDTMTASMRLRDLAGLVGVNKRTIWTQLDTLVSIGAIRIVGGGRGRQASYELLALPRAGGQPALALMMVVAPTRPRPAIASGQSLFDQPVTEVFTIDAEGRTPEKNGSFVIRWLVENGSFFLPWVAKKGSILRKVGSYVRPLAIDDVRARATYNNLRTTTTSAAADAAPEKRTPPRCPFHGTVHAYCDGRVHVPTPFHLEERRKLPRRPGQTDAELDAEQFAIYAAVLAAIPDGTRIFDKNEFAFWNRVLRGTTPTRRAWIPFRRPPSTVRREGGASGGNCPHTPRCVDTGSVTAFVVCRDRSLADARAERERKSG